MSCLGENLVLFISAASQTPHIPNSGSFDSMSDRQTADLFGRINTDKVL